MLGVEDFRRSLPGYWLRPPPREVQLPSLASARAGLSPGFSGAGALGKKIESVMIAGGSREIKGVFAVKCNTDLKSRSLFLSRCRAGSIRLNLGGVEGCEAKL